MKEINFKVLSPASGNGYVNMPIHSYYVNIMNKGIKAGEEFKDNYNKLAKKVSLKKNKFIFCKPYLKKDLLDYTVNSINKHYPTKENLNIENYLFFTSFVKAVDSNLYEELFYGLDKLMLGAYSVDKEVNVQAVQFLHLVTNMSLRYKFYNEFINFEKLSNDNVNTIELYDANPFKAYLNDLYLKDSLEIFKHASHEALNRIQLLLEKIKNNELDSFNKDDLLDIKAYLSIYAKKIKLNDNYPFVATNIVLDNVYGFHTVFRSIDEGLSLSDDQMSEIEGFIGISYESVSEVNDLGMRYALYKNSDLTQAKKESLDEIKLVLQEMIMQHLATKN